MKKIDEFGISPWPWENHNQFVIAKDDGTVVAASNYRDARLIAGAPELYEALAAFVNWYEKNKPLTYEENGVQMISHYSKKALAKASGESEVK